MKFAWKIFLCTVIIVALSFATGGYIILSGSLETSISQEVESIINENALMCFGFATAATNTITTDILSDDTITDIAAQINKTSGENKFLRISDENLNILYLSSTVPISNNWVLNVLDERIYYKINSVDGKYFLIACSKSVIVNKIIYFENIRDITDIFERNRIQMKNYRQLSLIFLLISSAVLFFISTLLTRPLRDLTHMTKKIAGGKFSERIETQSNDEIGEFIRDFNIMAQALDEKIQKLELESEQKERFIADFSHELKTPLTSIIGYSDMLRSQRLDDEQILKSANYIFSEGKRLESLSLKLLDLNLVKNQEWELVKVNPAYLASRIYDTVSFSIEKSGILFTCDVDDCLITVEPDLFGNLLMNLLDNARKATPSDGKIWLVGKEEGNGYTFWVGDNGNGIPADKLDKITEAFYMVDKSRARAQNGAGLGLALCERIAELHNTRLEFSSDEGVGTVVRIHLENQKY